jgi:hypothetical protein
MHPRERVLGIAYLCHEKGQEIPKHVLKEAEQLGIDVSEFQITTTNNKETANGRQKTKLRNT